MPDWRVIMAGRRLTPEEREAWARVARTVRPRPSLSATLEKADEAAFPPPVLGKAKTVAGRQTCLTAKKPISSDSEAIRPPADVLDGSWEKRFRSGRIEPDMSIDLHGHSLAAAHLQLERTLAAALSRGARVVHVITGKERKPQDRAGFSMRGAIRAEIGHWLAHGPHAGSIASVRTAHPRHGGSGALYIILRRKR